MGCGPYTEQQNQLKTNTENGFDNINKQLTKHDQLFKEYCQWNNKVNEGLLSDDDIKTFDDF